MRAGGLKEGGNYLCGLFGACMANEVPSGLWGRRGRLPVSSELCYNRRSYRGPVRPVDGINAFNSYSAVPGHPEMGGGTDQSSPNKLFSHRNIDSSVRLQIEGCQH